MLPNVWWTIHHYLCKCVLYGSDDDLPWVFVQRSLHLWYELLSYLFQPGLVIIIAARWSPHYCDRSSLRLPNWMDSCVLNRHHFLSNPNNTSLFDTLRLYTPTVYWVYCVRGHWMLEHVAKTFFPAFRFHPAHPTINEFQPSRRASWPSKEKKKKKKGKTPLRWFLGI